MNRGEENGLSRPLTDLMMLIRPPSPRPPRPVAISLLVTIRRARPSICVNNHIPFHVSCVSPTCRHLSAQCPCASICEAENDPDKKGDRPPVCKRDRRDDDAASGFLCRRASVRRRRCHLYQNWWVHKHSKLSFASCAIRFRDLCVIVRGAFLRRLEIFLATSPNFI